MDIIVHLVYWLLIVVAAIIVVILTGIVLKIVLQIVAYILFKAGKAIHDWLENTFPHQFRPPAHFIWKPWYVIFLIPPMLFIVLYFLGATLILTLISGFEILADKCFQYGDIFGLNLNPVMWRERNIWLTILFIPVGIVLLFASLLLLLSGLMVALAKIIYELTVVTMQKLATHLWRFANRVVDAIRRFIQLSIEKLWLAVNELWQLINHLMWEIIDFTRRLIP